MKKITVSVSKESYEKLEGLAIKRNQSDKQKNIVRKIMFGNKRRAKNEINTNIC